MENGKRFDGSYFSQFGSGSPRTTAQNANTGQHVSRVMTGKEYSEYKKARRESAKAERSAQHGESARRNEASLRGAYQKQKKQINKGLVAALSVVGITAVGLAVGATLYFGGGNSSAPAPDAPLDTPPVITEPAEPTAPEVYEARGIYDGYGETGMWVEANGVEDGIWRQGKNSVKFADASKLTEICDHDEVEMVKYTTDNEVEALSDYIANITSRVQVDRIAGLPDGVNLDEFSGKSITGVESQLESLSDSDYDAKKQDFDAIMDLAYTRPVTLDGDYDNAFMSLKDPAGGITHENMQVVRCKTREAGTPAVEFYWLDKNGNEVGSITAKIGRVDNGGDEYDFTGCTQVVNKRGSNPGVYSGTPEVDEDGTPEDGGGTPTGEQEEKGDEDKTGGGEPETEDEETQEGGGDPQDEDPTPDDTPSDDGEPDDGTPDDDTPGDEPGDETPPDDKPGAKPDEKPAKNTESEIENAGPRATVVTTPGEQTEDPSATMAGDQAAARDREAEEQRQAEATRAAQAEAERRAAEEAEARRAEAAAKEAAEREAREAADREAARQAEEAEAARAAAAAKAAEEAAAAEQAARAAAEQAAREEAAAATAREAAAEEQAASDEQTAPAGGESAGERAGLSY